MSKPSYVHWVVVKRILIYVKGIVDIGLSICKSTPTLTSVFKDADLVDCTDDGQSTRCFVVFFGPNLISWNAWEQTALYRLSTVLPLFWFKEPTRISKLPI
jgi:hypothetical protein